MQGVERSVVGSFDRMQHPLGLLNRREVVKVGRKNAELSVVPERLNELLLGR